MNWWKECVEYMGAMWIWWALGAVMIAALVVTLLKSGFSPTKRSGTPDDIQSR